MKKVWLGLVWLLGACLAGCPPKETRTPVPLQRETGKPVVISALGYEYTIPGQIDVPDHFDVPGTYLIDFVDRINRCTGYVHFETVADGAEHLVYMKNKMDTLAQSWAQSQIKSQTGITSITLLGAEARHTSFVLSKGNRDAYAEFIDQHYPAQNLSVIAFTFCTESSFITQTSQKIVSLINSQRAEGASSTSIPAPIK